ncbi:MAG: hypothetical protein Q7T72_12645 [Bacteroidales bacterium]|nr:hypothetical protein [Bacteroidales bacterium]
MQRSFFILFIILTILSGCRKDDTPRRSGTDTIDNTTYKTTTYYTFGFSFSKATKVSTLDSPGPDITINVNNDNPVNRLILQANNLENSFYKIGDYPDAASAVSAFNNLKTVGAYQWEGMADPINANQVWDYRTGSEHYAKIRIVSTKNEIRNNLPYGECTFEWLYQPDGSLTFPGK